MEKFTKLEKELIVAGLRLAMDSDLSKHQAMEESGKTPIFTVEYIESIYKELIEKVEKMTKKK
jgi:hypothetical protein